MDDTKKLHIVTTALDVFFKYGYKRVSMNEIAETAGISRAGLYLHFKSKEEIFSAAILQYGDTLIEEITKGLPSKNTTEEKIYYAFEVWTIANFDDSLNSPEVREITDSSFEFAGEALDTCYGKFEAVLASLYTMHSNATPGKTNLSPEELAHISTSALRGFKLVAKSSAEISKLIRDLLSIILAA